MTRSTLALPLSLLLLAAPAAAQDDCVACHEQVTPGIVGDWRTSRHHEEDVSCADCHGDGHTRADDVAAVETVTAETCGLCHGDRYDQFSRGKHAFSWASMQAMPTTHWKPMELIDGMKGCGGCHKLGLKDQVEIERLKEEGSVFGHASCDACHTRHTFSVAEAREPEACATCHMGFDHPQWEMWSTSKHGVRHRLKRDGVLPASAAAPTCQTCHMPNGDHEVRTAWGFLAVRTDGLGPYPGEDEQWWADRVTILQALGVLDPQGQPTERLQVVQAADVARFSAEDWDRERAKKLAVCSECHSENFARAELEKGDRMIRETDHLMAEAVRIVAGLYQDGILEQPENYAYPFPDLLTFHDAPTPIEQRLFTMHLKHRMRAFQGVFHANPDYALWYGWNELVQDLTEIRHLAEEMRRAKGGD
ncbi:MAG: cytochrome C [Planctomycetota bacterium]|nr:MAG: cytochrome C [Planctomycetota bacterium]